MDLETFLDEHEPRPRCVICKQYPEGSEVRDAFEEWVRRKLAGETNVSLSALHRGFLKPVHNVTGCVTTWATHLKHMGQEGVLR